MLAHKQSEILATLWKERSPNAWNNGGQIRDRATDTGIFSHSRLAGTCATIGGHPSQIKDMASLSGPNMAFGQETLPCRLGDRGDA